MRMIIIPSFAHSTATQCQPLNHPLPDLCNSSHGYICVLQVLFMLEYNITIKIICRK